MKKLFIILFLSFVGLAFGRYNIDTVISDTLNTTITLTDSTDIQAFEKICFRISYDETEVGNSVSAAITFELGTDDDWTDFNILLGSDGTDAPQANVSFSSDGEKVVYLPYGVSGDQLRITATGTNTDADDIAVIVVKRIGWRQ